LRERRAVFATLHGTRLAHFPKCAARRYRARLYTRREWARVGGVDRTVPVVGGAEEIGEREINA
jgi:hypothetical protein